MFYYVHSSPLDFLCYLCLAPGIWLPFLVGSFELILHWGYDAFLSLFFLAVFIQQGIIKIFITKDSESTITAPSQWSELLTTHVSCIPDPESDSRMIKKIHKSNITYSSVEDWMNELRGTINLISALRGTYRISHSCAKSAAAFRNNLPSWMLSAWDSYKEFVGK